VVLSPHFTVLHKLENNTLHPSELSVAKEVMGSTKEFPDQPMILKMLLAGKYSQVGLLNTSTLCHLLHIPPADSTETVRWKMEKTKLSKEKQNKKDT